MMACTGVVARRGQMPKVESVESAGRLDVGSEGKTEKPKVTPQIFGLRVAICFDGESHRRASLRGKTRS